MTLVEEIQKAALDKNVLIADLLRQVKLVSAKLKLSDTLEWVDQELNGFSCEDRHVPEYRIAKGLLTCHHPYRGSYRASGDADTIAAMSLSYFKEPISSLEQAWKSGQLKFELPVDHEFARAMSQGSTATYSVVFSANVLAAIVDKVRSMVLDWAISLEEAGIYGDGVGFTMAEKQKAEDAAARIEINNYGHMHQGDIVGDQNRTTISGDDRSINKIESDIFVELTEKINAEIPEGDRKELLALVEQMKSLKGQKGFSTVYQKFVSAAADHLTVLAPFIGALSGFIV